MPGGFRGEIMVKYGVLLSAILLFAFRPAMAAGGGEQQSHAAIHEVAESFVREQTATLPGRVTVKVDNIDRRLTRPACRNLEAFLPPGSRLFGNGMVGIRCPGRKGWTLFIPVHIKVTVEMLVANRPLSPGQILADGDFSRQEGELTQNGVVIDPAEAVGKVLKYAVGAGQVLRQDMLRPPYMVKQGQVVHLQIDGGGFSVSSEGQALNNASEGQDVRVKTDSGKVVSGKAMADGMVKVLP